MSERGPYPGKPGCEYYKNKLETGNTKIDLEEESSFFYEKGFYCPGWNRHFNPFDCQAPIQHENLIEYIDIAKKDYPDHELIIVTSPTSKVDSRLDKYRIIKNNDTDLDLYILSQCDVIITSKSLFCFSSLYFGNHRTKFIAMWGHIVGTGITTKYDRQTNNMYLY